jgi:hypothetical protein
MPTTTKLRRMFFASGAVIAIWAMWLLVSIANHQAEGTSQIVPSSRVKMLGCTESHFRLDIDGDTITAGPSKQWRKRWIAECLKSLLVDDERQSLRDVAKLSETYEVNSKITVRKTSDRACPYVVHVGDEQVGVKVISKASWMQRLRRWFGDLCNENKPSSAKS